MPCCVNSTRTGKSRSMLAAVIAVKPLYVLAHLAGRYGGTEERLRRLKKNAGRETIYGAVQPGTWPSMIWRLKLIECWTASSWAPKRLAALKGRSIT
jgi:hypothetical protein